MDHWVLSGIPLRTVGAPYVARSRSRETTFQQDIEDWDRAPSSDVEAIEQAAQEALDAFTSRGPVRLLGVRAELEV